MSPKLPVTVIGGYLGAGKTTLVNHLLRNANGLRLAVLVNEFGELAIDEDLIEAEGDDIISIAGGCVCCSFGSDLTGAMMDLAKLDPPPDHLIIESSGVAIPSAIVGTVSLLPTFRVDGIVILADAETLRTSANDKYMGDTVLRQISDANIVVLNKTDLVDEETALETTRWLERQNSDVRIIEAIQGAVPLEVLFDSFVVAAVASTKHYETGNLKMSTLEIKEPIDVEALAKKLVRKSSGLIRAKGFAMNLDGELSLIQVVGNRWEVSLAKTSDNIGIVCLGMEGEVALDDLYL
ncbi:CobW family GTP-binding protein [Planktotalea sp.]|uniref:CobW family GTP-binding protein n=1 Tax=Planktotalea sp. TaxID=2029877 RepID=UPI003D6C586A